MSPQIIKVVQNKGMSPSMINSVKKTSTTQISPILITKPKRPRLSILKGKAMKFRTGLIKKLIKPRISPQSNKVFQDPINSTPETK